MLSEQDVAAWATRVGLSHKAQIAVAHIRRSEPARRVGGGRCNVTGRYPSKKMGVTIQFESHRVELPAVFELEHDDDVLEYYDQVPSIKLDYYSADGRHLGVLHTPDFFVIRSNSAGWEECKTEEELTRLSERSPNRYRRVGQDWICPPGQQYAEPLGLYYRVRSSAAINWLFQRNIQFLEDYLRNAPQVSSLHRQRVQAVVAAQPGCWLEDLFQATDSQISRDEVYSLIASGDIFVDLRSAVLPEPEKVAVWLEKASQPDGADAGQNAGGQSALGAGETLDWDGTQWTVLNARLGVVTLHAENGSIVEIPLHTFHERIRQKRIKQTGARPENKPPPIHRQLLVASEADLAQATRRFHIVSRTLRGEACEAVPPRTLRRWIAAYRVAQDKHGSGYLGLLPKPNMGNPANRLQERVRSLMTEFIDKDYETLKRKTMYATWSALKLNSERQQIPAPSYKTFCLAVHQRAGVEQTKKRQGSRAAYQLQPFFWELEQRTPRHGDRPFEIAHIDHTQADIWVVCSQTGRLLGRPWLSLLTDAFSRRILALYLTFDPPSYRSCMMILRECVRRHGRVPQILVLDGGKEFESVYLETLLARCEVTKKTRPPAKARFGSTCERIFGTANKQFLYNLQGNTQAARSRQMTQSVDPRNHAAWPFKELHKRLIEYAYEVYDTLDHPALGQSPREAFEATIALTGNRSHRKIAYDQNFLILTLPTTRKGTAKIAPGRGVKINHLYYWSEHFRNPTWETKQAPVRYDPFDVGTAYAFVHRQWIECHAEYYSVLHGHSEREIHLISEELRKRRQNHSGQFAVTAKKLAEFLESVELEEGILIQRLSDLEARSLDVQSGLRSKSEVVSGLEPQPSPTELAPADPPATLVTYGEL
jgi:transposase InsO family protein